MDLCHFRGAILGHLVGDALGVPVEFMSRAQLKRKPVESMTGYGTHNQPPGTWSDDGSMMLCLLEALAAGGGVPEAARLWCRWLMGAHWTPHGKVFDVGGTTSVALLRVAQVSDPRKAGEDHERSNGNGSLMRVIPAALMLGHLPQEQFLGFVHDQSRVTHAHPRSLIGCGIYSLLVRRLARGEDRETAWEAARTEALEYYSAAYPDEVEHYARALGRETQSWNHVPEDSIRGAGYVVSTLEAALWCFFTTTSYAECVLKAVNLGDDTDTTGAVAGGLAGVFHGDAAIPGEWIRQLSRLSDIEDLTVRAHARAFQPH